MALMQDGETFAEATMVIALGITMAGKQCLLGFVETDTENEKVLTPFLRSLVERGLDVSLGLPVVVDGGKGLRAAVRKAFRHRALVQRCQWHKHEHVVSCLVADDEPRLVTLIELATASGRCGYRRGTALLGKEGWAVNHKRVERLWRREGLKAPQTQPKRVRRWCADGSCVRRRPTYRHHVCDFVAERTHDGRPVKILAVDEYSRECLALVVARRLRSAGVLEAVAELFMTHGVQAHIRSDSGYVESFNGELRDKLLDREIIYTLTEAKVLIERWRRQYNTVQSRRALGHRPRQKRRCRHRIAGS